ncbi:MAG: hypothetical protein LBV74_04475 [Tannerella sp.]|nr:hypothetical protein [Tannerella sp.]
MEHLQIHNVNYLTYKDGFLTVDVLGGVDLSQVERMVCTLRIICAKHPVYRTTLDLYNDDQTDRLMRTLCDRWELKLIDVSKTLYNMTLELESYRLEQLKFKGKNPKPVFEPSEEDRKTALKILKSNSLIKQLTDKLNTSGIIGEDENAVILFLALASHRFNSPFSVLCLAKSGIGKSYILQKLADCMPDGSYSFHSKISANALYYFDSSMIQDKALLIEDLEWTTQMLQPLATLQSQGKLINTRATKDKDGMIHSTTFEVVAKLCLVACAYSDKNFEEISLPFLCLHLNHSHAQDIAVMEYQKRYRAGQIKAEDIKQAQYGLKCLLATLQNVSVINPFATLIGLPEDIACPRKSLLLLLNFIEAVTFFFQYQREQAVDKATGEVFIKTHPEDIEFAFKYLKNTLFRRADELSTSARGFYGWLQKFLAEAKTKQFTALDIRKAKPVHPRTLNRYLQELKLFSYIQVAGGNRHREGYRYKMTEFGNHTGVQSRIERDIQATLKSVWEAYSSEQGSEKAISATESEAKKPQSEPTASKRKRIEEKEDYTLKVLLELETCQPQREYMTADFTAITGRNPITEARYLKRLWEKGTLNRTWKNRQYCYTLATTGSGTVGQTPLSNPQDSENKQ